MEWIAPILTIIGFGWRFWEAHKRKKLQLEFDAYKKKVSNQVGAITIMENGFAGVKMYDPEDLELD